MSDDYLVDTLATLARVPSAVPPGTDTLMVPDHPVLLRYVQEHLRPAFAAAGARDLRDLPLNQLAARFGDGDGPCLVLMAYTPTQHHNLMREPWSGAVRTPAEHGVHEPCLFGQGVTQNKAHQACLLDLARWIARDGVALHGTLWLCINNEGRSSHDCSFAALDALPQRPDLVIQLFCTSFDVSVGNRGRIDVQVLVEGRASHSSSPPAAGRVIDTTADVIARLAVLDAAVGTRSHPLLGREQVVPYQVGYRPLVPHTLPASARVVVDRRLLPGTDPLAATGEIRRALAALDARGCGITVEPGVTMLPALLASEDRGVLAALDAAIAAHIGPPRHTIYGGTFDAGGPASRGIPTVMFGVPDTPDLLGDDYVRLSHLRLESAIVRDTVRGFLAGHA